jgi:hypothetical protein
MFSQPSQYAMVRLQEPKIRLTHHNVSNDHEDGPPARVQVPAARALDGFAIRTVQLQIVVELVEPPASPPPDVRTAPLSREIRVPHEGTDGMNDHDATGWIMPLASHRFE